MRVLQLCHKPPKPAIDGGCIAINTISEGLLANGISLTVLTLSTYKHPFKLENYSEDFIEATAIKGIFVDTKLNVVDAFSNLVTSDSYNVSRFFSTDFDILLRKTFQEKEFDVVHLESLFMTTYCHTIRKYTKAKIVLRSHNLEYMIWDRLADKATNPAKKTYLRILAKQLKKYEVNVLSSLNAIAAITDEDKKKYVDLGFKKPIVTVPFGINLESSNPDLTKISKDQLASKTLRCFHLGAMDWQPNLEGVNWFLASVWPALIHAFPNFTLHIGGRKMPVSFIESHKHIASVINHGEVNSSTEFINENDIMIVPLLSGGGMRVKIIEGMALGKIVIATSIAAEGIQCQNRKNILIANTKEEFIAQLQWLFEDTSRFFELRTNAVQLINEVYDNNKIIKELVQFYQTLQNE